MKHMITVEEADKIIFSHIKAFPAVRVALDSAFGMVLREDLVADRDLPPFHRSMMDGISINTRSWQDGRRTFPIDGIQKAGMPALRLKHPSHCLEIMTGAVLPEGCDGIIPVESVQVKSGKAVVRANTEFSSMNHIHAQGSDHQKGDVLVAQGTRLGPAQVAVAAAAGFAEVSVTGSPKIAVIGTGDELVPIDTMPEPYQIRQSNSFAMAAVLHDHGFHQVTRLHVPDDQGILRSQLDRVLGECDVVVLSGGVSMGKTDLVPEILASLGVKVLFHKVQQKPGKPFWFGQSKDGKPVFALPGNPVSTQVCMVRYVLPYLNRASGQAGERREYAVLKEDVEISSPLTRFLPVHIMSKPSGHLLASAVMPNSSGDFVALARSDGFLELPSGTFRFSAGFSAPFFRF